MRAHEHSPTGRIRPPHRVGSSLTTREPMTERTHNDDDPDVADVLTALDDDTCRVILTELSEPMTATDLTDRCDIPKSTLYRKLDLLSRADLVHEAVTLGRDGSRATRYERDVSSITVSIEDDDSFSVSMDRKQRSPDEHLADLWSDMGDEL